MRVKTSDANLERAFGMADAIDAARQPLHQGMRLGDIIRELTGIDEAEDVVFDFGGFYPSSLDSYRGYYSDLALSFGEEEITVGKLLAELRSAVGKVFEGYKGGAYLMSESTPVWVANYGRSHGVAVVRVERQGWRVVLHTAMID